VRGDFALQIFVIQNIYYRAQGLLSQYIHWWSNHFTYQNLMRYFLLVLLTVIFLSLSSQRLFSSLPLPAFSDDPPPLHTITRVIKTGLQLQWTPGSTSHCYPGIKCFIVRVILSGWRGFMASCRIVLCGLVPPNPFSLIRLQKWLFPNARRLLLLASLPLGQDVWPHGCLKEGCEPEETTLA
jgi:hypothetical protein